MDGRLIEKSAGLLKARILAILIRILETANQQFDYGEFYGSRLLYQCFPNDPERIRRPDLSFIRKGAFNDGYPEGHCKVVPDWVCEVISPNDNLETVQYRIQDFLNAGTRVAWVVIPGPRLVHVYHAGEKVIRIVSEEDVIECPEVFPGFSCAVSEFFPRKCN